MVVYPGDHLGFATVGQPDPAHDVHLPQLHRHFALPPLVILPATPPCGRDDQTVPDQHPMHGNP